MVWKHYLRRQDCMTEGYSITMRGRCFSSTRGQREPLKHHPSLLSHRVLSYTSVLASGGDRACLKFVVAGIDVPSMDHPEVLATLLQSYICATGERSHSWLAWKSLQARRHGYRHRPHGLAMRGYQKMCNVPWCGTSIWHSQFPVLNDKSEFARPRLRLLLISSKSTWSTVTLKEFWLGCYICMRLSTTCIVRGCLLSC